VDAKMWRNRLLKKFFGGGARGSRSSSILAYKAGEYKGSQKCRVQWELML